MALEQVLDKILRLKSRGDWWKSQAVSPSARTRGGAADAATRGCEFTVLLETSGETSTGARFGQSSQDRRREVSDSGEDDTFCMENLESAGGARTKLSFCTEQPIGLRIAREFTKRHNLAGRVNAVLFSPAFRRMQLALATVRTGLLDPQELAEWMIARQRFLPVWTANCIIHLGPGAEGV